MNIYRLYKYRVHMTVHGSVSRPPYSGYVEVVAETNEEASDKARAKLRKTFPDVAESSIKVNRLEIFP